MTSCADTRRPVFSSFKTPQIPTPELSFVMPCFNESESIEEGIRTWISFAREARLNFELVVVNDGSNDGTSRILDHLRRDKPELRVIHGLHEGYARALKRGCLAARGTSIAQIDAAGRFMPSDFSRLWEMREKADLILGMRTHRLDRLRERGLSCCVRLMNRVLHRVVLRDPETPFRVYRRDVMECYLPHVRMEASLNNALTVLVAKKHPDRIVEVPIPYRVPIRGERNLGLVAWAILAIQEFRQLFRLRPLAAIR